MSPLFTAVAWAIDAKPWRNAFMRERALPTAVRGPVLFAAFRRFAERINAEEAEQLQQALEQARLAGGRR